MYFLVLLPSFHQSTRIHLQLTLTSTHLYFGSRKQQPLPPCVINSCIIRPPVLFVFIVCPTSHPYTTDYDPPGAVANHWLRALLLRWRQMDGLMGRTSTAALEVDSVQSRIAMKFGQ